MAPELPPWEAVLAFWFPEGRSLEVDAAEHDAHWMWRMRGGADEEIVARFPELTTRAAAGELHGWAAHPEGRLALLIVLDQFSRSLWRDTPRAFAQDPAALRLSLEGLTNGHYERLALPWFQVVFGLPLGHAEGRDHLARVERLIELRKQIALKAPAHLKPRYEALVQQAGRVREVIATFGRHPHRNPVLGRPSTPAEEAYLATGDFPHLRSFER